MSLHMLGAISIESLGVEVSDVMNIVHPIGKGVLSIFAPQLAQSVEDIQVQTGVLYKDKLAAAVVVDNAAAASTTKALVSTVLATRAAGDAKVAADAQALADQAAAEAALAQLAIPGFPASVRPQRVAAIQKSLAATAAKLQKLPTDLRLQCAAKAWQVVLERVKVEGTAPAPVTQIPVTQSIIPTEKTMSLNMLGAIVGQDFSKMDWKKIAGGALSTVATVTEGVQAGEEAKKVAAADKTKIDAAIAADADAGQAKAKALNSAAVASTAAGAAKAPADARAAADQSALDIASAAMDAASAALPASAAEPRLVAANGWRKAVTAKLQANPTDPYSQSAVKAWTWVLNKIQNAQIVKSDKPPAAPVPSEPFYQKKIVGPVTILHAGLGVTSLGLGIYFRKSILRLFGIG